MMDLLGYTDFDRDVQKYLNNVIAKYNLHFSNEYLLLLNKQLHHYVCLKNEFVIMTINNIESFPYQDTVAHFYFFDNLDTHKLIKIEDDSITNFLSIKREEFEAYCLNHYSNFAEKDPFIKDEKGGYLYGLKSINDLIEKFYKPLFTGEKTTEDYLKFLNDTQNKV
ncbi:hypothetical protein [Tenacibaculum maritimum]|uniref:hypothetical protein n=2 Tax=Tenacibaculum maritimum TaxID=107401 RepID=UPI00387709F2